MLRKLIKYELLADYRKYGALYAAMLLISGLLLFFDKMTSWVNNNLFAEIMVTVLGVVFGALVVVVCAMVMVFSTMRFYKNLVRDEGYLMHTLPVPTWKLIISKLIAVYIWTIFTTIAVGICSGIAFGEPMWLFEMIDDLSEFIVESKVLFGGNAFVTFLIYMGIFFVLAPGCSMVHIYFCFALGNLFSKHKLGMAVLMYFVTYIAEQIISSVAMMFISSDMVEVMLIGETETTEISDAAVMGFGSDVLLMTLILSLIVAVGYYIGTERIFAKKLNLE